MDSHFHSLEAKAQEAAQDRGDLHEFIRNRLDLISTTPIGMKADGAMIKLFIHHSSYITFGEECHVELFTEESTWEKIEDWLKTLNYFKGDV